MLLEMAIGTSFWPWQWEQPCKTSLCKYYSVLSQEGTPKLCPGPMAASWTITFICLYYFFNMTCLYEPITMLSESIGQTWYLYMEHVVEAGIGRYYR